MALSTTATLPSPVDVSRTFVLVGYRTAGPGGQLGARMVSAELTDPTTITIQRDLVGTADIPEVLWQAVELKDGSTVQRGTATLASDVSQAALAIAAVDTARSSAFVSAQPVGGQNMGRTPLATDDIVGVGSFTLALTSTQPTITRDNTAADATVGWFVVQWGGPG